MRRRGSFGGHPAGAYHRACDSQIPATERKSARFVTCRGRVSYSSTEASSAGARPGASSAAGSAMPPSSSCSSGPDSTRRRRPTGSERHPGRRLGRLRGPRRLGRRAPGRGRPPRRPLVRRSRGAAGGRRGRPTSARSPSSSRPRRVSRWTFPRSRPSRGAVRSSGRTARETTPRPSCAPSSPPSGRTSTRPSRCRRSSCRARGPRRRARALGGRHPARDARRAAPSRHSSSRAVTIPRSRRSATSLERDARRRARRPARLRHNVQLHPEFNRVLLEFVDAAAAGRRLSSSCANSFTS